MLILAFILFCCGFLLSAVFSGAETGFYRMPRIRLKLDAIEGDRTANLLLWLSNHPSFFVAANLTGNNIANYGVSISSVIIIQYFFGQGVLIELLGGILLTPLMFVYGEMFPKNLFLLAPNRLLRKVTPIMVFFIVLFLPITLILWSINRIASFLLGRTQDTVRLSLARSELSKVLDEGHEAGVLFDVQRGLAAGVFDVASMKITDLIVPAADFPKIAETQSPMEVVEIVRNLEICDIPVSGNGSEFIGYVRKFELELLVRGVSVSEGEPLEMLPSGLPVHQLIDIDEGCSPLIAMSLFQSTGTTLGCVFNSRKEPLGLITVERLRNAMFRN